MKAVKWYDSAYSDLQRRLSDFMDSYESVERHVLKERVFDCFVGQTKKEQKVSIQVVIEKQYRGSFTSVYFDSFHETFFFHS